MESNKTQTHIIVTGNEKGGAGKTTTTIHLIAYLLNLGFKVTCLDLDSRQRSLTRYLENREKYSQKRNINLQIPVHHVLSESNAQNISDKEQEEREIFLKHLNDAKENSDFIVIDTPGSNTYLSRLAHSYADSIITPVNDSFLDLDVLAHFDSETYDVIRPSIYSETIWKQKIERARRDKGEINWLVVRNRLSNIDAKNKRNVGEAIHKLANKVGFRVSEGFSERVIFKELFLYGLTLLDLNAQIFDIKLTLSHLAAKEELKKFLGELNIDEIDNAIARQKDDKKTKSKAISQKLILEEA